MVGRTSDCRGELVRLRDRPRDGRAGTTGSTTAGTNFGVSASLCGSLASLPGAR